MTTVKHTQTRQTSSKDSSSDHNESLKRKDELMGKQEEMALLKSLDWTTKGKCTMKKWKPEQIKSSGKCPSHGTLQDKYINCEPLEESNMTNFECETNKRTSKRLTTEWMWNWSQTFVVDDGWQDFRSETLLVNTEQVFKDEIHLVMSEHLIVQTEENLNYTMTETRKEQRSLTFALSKQTSEESSVQMELLQKSAEVITVQQDVQQGKPFQVTMFNDSNLLPEEGNKCFEFVKIYGFVHEQQLALQDN